MIISRGNKILISNKIAQDAVACFFAISFASLAMGLLVLCLSSTSTFLYLHSDNFFRAGAFELLLSIAASAISLPFYDVIEIDRARAVIFRKWYGLEWSVIRIEADLPRIEVHKTNQIGKWPIFAIRISDSTDAVDVAEGYDVARLLSLAEDMRQRGKKSVQDYWR